MFQRGVYEHFTGKLYRLLTLATHSETMELMVVYQALYGDEQVWVRPARMWNENVLVDGKSVPRFRWIRN